MNIGALHVTKKTFAQQQPGTGTLKRARDGTHTQCREGCERK
eukprot:COSAG06_NODE_2038_length_7765_cov_124.776285_1_plen_42_part_00